MIAIRVDANEYIASGHAMRCLSVADALAELGEEVIFISADRCALDMAGTRGYKGICLDSNWRDMEGELTRLIEEIEKLCPNLLLIDSYQVTERYFEEVRKSVKIAYIDDLNAFDYPVDIVINYSIYADDIVYPKNKKYLLGTKFAPLRSQFDISEDDLEEALSGRDTNKHILVTTGASDPHHVTDKVIRAILNEPGLSEYDIWVVRGRFFEESEEDRASERIKIYENVENMAELMLDSTMAVSAGGSTLYELCACLVPTVTFSYADNQLGNVEGFSKRGIMPYAGDAATDDDIGIHIVQNLLRFHKNTEYMKDVENKMRTLECGKGAKHLAKALLNP